MAKYSTITVIYNPNSTGSGKSLARAFKDDITTRLPSQIVQLIATKHAGHAEELAYSAAKATKNPLIISASGDGGYNEVINGLMKAKAEGARPIAGLLPAGNANDHYRSVHEQDIIDAIESSRELDIDILKLSATVEGEDFQRCGHSYIGVGISPKIGRELNKVKLNIFNQIWIVIKVLLAVKSVPLIIDGKQHFYDSVIFSNVNKMSKVLTLSKKLRVNDGKFEVSLFTSRHKLALIMLFLQASTTGITEDKQVTSFDFETVGRTSIQVDGEVFTLDAHSEASVSIEHKALRCIV